MYPVYTFSVLTVWRQLFQQGKLSICLLIYSIQRMFEVKNSGGRIIIMIWCVWHQRYARHADSRWSTFVAAKLLYRIIFSVDAFHVLVVIKTYKKCRVYTNNRGQMFSHFKPPLAYTNPRAWEQNITTPSALFPSSVFCFFSELIASLLHALIWNLFGFPGGEYCSFTALCC